MRLYETRGKWVAAYFCVSCNHEITKDESLLAKICPYCGHSKENWAICPEVKNRPKRQITVWLDLWLFSIPISRDWEYLAQ